MKAPWLGTCGRCGGRVEKPPQPTQPTPPVNPPCNYFSRFSPPHAEPCIISPNL